MSSNDVEQADWHEELKSIAGFLCVNHEAIAVKPGDLEDESALLHGLVDELRRDAAVKGRLHAMQQNVLARSVSPFFALPVPY